MVTWRHLLSKTITFGCVERADSRYLVVGVPLDQTASYKPGTRFAPTRIRDAACNIELCSLYRGISLENLGFNDLGDVVIPPGDLAKAFENIERVVKGIREEYSGKLPILLGGEHTITYPVVSTLRSDIDTLVVFDAHLDLRSEYLGSEINHATVMRRILESLNIPIVFVGVRAYSLDEINYLSSIANGKVTVCDANNVVRGECVFRDYGRVYLSIDMDVLDPAYAPGVSNPEPFGLTPREFMHALVSVLEHAEKLVGVDVVEVNPLVDVNDITSILAAKIIIELAGYVEEWFK